MVANENGKENMTKKKRAKGGTQRNQPLKVIGGKERQAPLLIES